MTHPDENAYEDEDYDITDADVLAHLSGQKALTMNPQESEFNLLSQVKRLMQQLLHADMVVHQRLVSAVRFIEDNGLWKADRDLDGNPFRSMTAYLPFLLGELKQAGLTDTMGVRQMRQWLAADKVFVQTGLLTNEQVQTLGIGVVEKVLQSASYDPKTGEIAEVVAPGSKKLNRQQTKALLGEVLDDRENWTVAAVAATADERRGVVRQSVRFIFQPSSEGEVRLTLIVLVLGEDTYRFDVQTAGMYTDLAEALVKRTGALSNLEELSYEDLQT